MARKYFFLTSNESCGTFERRFRPTTCHAIFFFFHPVVVSSLLIITFCIDLFCFHLIFCCSSYFLLSMSTLSHCPPLTPPHSPRSWSAGRKRRLSIENDNMTIPFAHPVDFSGKKRRFTPSPPPSSFAPESTFPAYSHSTQNHASLYDPAYPDSFPTCSPTQSHTSHDTVDAPEPSAAAPFSNEPDPDLYVSSEDCDMDGIETYRVLRRNPDGGLLVESDADGGLPMELRPGEHKMRIPDFVLQK